MRLPPRRQHSRTHARAHVAAFHSQGAIDNINLFSLITIVSFFLTAPFALAFEGVRFTPAAVAAYGADFSVARARRSSYLKRFFFFL